MARSAYKIFFFPSFLYEFVCQNSLKKNYICTTIFVTIFGQSFTPLLLGQN